MYKPVSTHFSMISAFVLGIMSGGLVLLAINLDLKWLVMGAVSIVFIATIMVIENRDRFFWVLFIMSLQVYISVRVLHMHAGSEGIEFPFAFICGLFLLTFYFISGQFSNKKNFLLGGDLLLPVIFILATTFSSLIFTDEKFVGLVSLLRLLEYYTLFLIGLNCVRSIKNLDNIVSLLITVLVLQCLVYYIQASLGITFTLTGEVLTNDTGVRAGGTVGANSAVFSAFVIPLIMMVIVKLMSKTVATNKRFLWLLVTALAVLAFILTLRRGAWGGLFLGFAVILYLGYRKNILSKGWVLSGLTFIVLTLVLAPVIANFVDTYRAGNPLASAFDERMRLNMIAWELIKAHPLLGTGPGSYAHVYKEYLSPEMAQGWLFTVHNTYLLTAAETGFLGLSAFCIFLITAFRLSTNLMSSNEIGIQHLGLAMSGGIVAYAFAIYWEPMNAFSPNALLWFLIGLMAGARRLQKSSHAAAMDVPRKSE